MPRPLGRRRGVRELLRRRLSDVPAVLPFCHDVIFLEDGDVVVLGKDSIAVTDLQGGAVDRKIDRINWDPVSVEKCGYRHYMLKEMFTKL